MDDLCAFADQQENAKTSAMKASSAWQSIQQWALWDNEKSDMSIRNAVLEAQRLSVKLPVIRKAKMSGTVKDEKGKSLFNLEKDQTIVCDIVSIYITLSPSNPIESLGNSPR